MKLPNKIDKTTIPSWVTEQDYAKRVADLESWLVSYYFWEKYNGDESEYVVARTMAESKMKAIAETIDLNAASDAVMVSLLSNAKEEGWFRFAEYETIEEYLQDIVSLAESRNPTAGRTKELSKLLSIIGTLKSMNVPVEKVVGIPENLTKARRAVPSLNKIVHDDSTSPEEKEEEIVEILEDIADPTVSVSGLTTKLTGKDRLRSGITFDGTVYELNGRTIVVIETNSPHYIETRLRVEFGVGDPYALIRSVTENISPRTVSMSRYILTDNGVAKAPHGSTDGVWLYSHDDFMETMKLRLGTLGDVLHYLEGKSIPIFRINTTPLTLEQIEVLSNWYNSIPDLMDYGDIQIVRKNSGLWVELVLSEE